MTLDIEAFHRTCPIAPAHKPWFVVRGPDNTFFIDHACPFGCAASSSNAGMIANAIADIWEALDIGPVSKYEDDFSVSRSPIVSNLARIDTHSYYYDEDTVSRSVAPLKIPWKMAKLTKFASEFEHIGFWWDYTNRTVSLTDTKRKKFRSRVRVFLASFDNAGCTLHDIQAIHGSLCHITFVYPAGRTRLPALSNFSSLFKNNKWRKLRLPGAIKNALHWWDLELAKPNVSRPLVQRRDLQEVGLYVDASTDWGIGIVLGDKWDAWRLTDSWSPDRIRHNTWLECLAIELAVYALEEGGLTDCWMRLWSDSQAAIGAFEKGRSPNPEMNLAIRRAGVVLDSTNVTLDLEYIASEANPADAVSRGMLPPAALRLPPMSFPAELKPYIVRA